MLGISRTQNSYQGYSTIGHSGGTLGFSANMLWVEGTDVIIVMLVNIGGMHSGLAPSPTSLFFNQVLLPAVMRYMGAAR